MIGIYINFTDKNNQSKVGKIIGQYQDLEWKMCKLPSGYRNRTVEGYNYFPIDKFIVREIKTNILHHISCNKHYTFSDHNDTQWKD